MANEAYASSINLDALVVPVKAATIYAAQETSLYLPGAIVPMIQVPAGSGSAQVPVMGSVTAQQLSAEADPGVDLDAKLPTDTKKTITLDLHAARTVLRDLGGINPDEIGRILGNAISTSVDKQVTLQMKDLTSQEITSGTLDLDEIFAAVATIRGNGEGGPLTGIVSTDAYAALMAVIGSNSFAGSEFQNSAMRNGFFGNIAGVDCYVSSYLNNTTWGGTENPKMCIFGQDALRGAIQGGVNLETERRAAAVGFDIVASVGFGADMVDATRGVKIIDAA